MVLKKRIYYGGFHGLLSPVIPKAPRSLRRRSLHSKSSEGGDICAFELLAAVAGKLLQESESSNSSIGSEGQENISIPKEVVKQEPLEVKVKPVKSEHDNQGSCSECEIVAQPTKLEPHLKELPQSDNESGLERTSIVTTSDSINKNGTYLRLGASEDKNGTGEIPSKPKGGSPRYGKLCGVNLDDNRVEATGKRSGVLTAAMHYSLKDQVANKSANSARLSFYKDPVPRPCFPRHRGNVKIDTRDDDENFFRYSQCSTRRRAFGSRSHAGYKRIRKMLNSRYRNVAPKLKDYKVANTISGGVRSFYNKRKNMYMNEQYQVDSAYKRRKLFHSNRAYIKETSSESISNSREKGACGYKRRSALNRGMTSSDGHKGALPSKDSHVKFSIKSFKVPELYVEVPETATVGSLKRSVMEAVTAILQSKLHVGVLLQGKKVRDDNRTLQQTGISQNCNLETLGFTLEPSSPEASPSLTPKETPLLLPCNTHPQGPQPFRPPSSHNTDTGFSDSSLDHPPPVTMDNLVEKKEESITFSAEVSTEEREADSKALVVVPALDAEVLSMVPLSEKPTKRYEPQRRIRRPFSVSEVEALVEAVEILGAGRWRDVKMRAFDDANHRTYVDLKDKWKTLVHTASISPQQRRGEPVPQDLLDRVLAAHAYWSQHQSKQHAKHQKTLEAPM